MEEGMEGEAEVRETLQRGLWGSRAAVTGGTRPWQQGRQQVGHMAGGGWHNNDKATKPASRSTSQPSGLGPVPHAPSASVTSVIKMEEVIKCTPESTVSIKGADTCKVSSTWRWISAPRCGLHRHLVRPLVCVASCFSAPQPPPRKLMHLRWSALTPDWGKSQREKESSGEGELTIAKYYPITLSSLWDCRILGWLLYYQINQF